MWDERYSQEGYLFGTEPAAALRRHAARFPARSQCLCTADGEGRNSVWLAEQGHEVTGWDSSRVAVDKARRLAETRAVSVSYSVKDAAGYDWAAHRYDVVVAVFIQFAGPDLRDKMFEGMKAATRPGGLVFLHGYTPEQLAFGTGGPRCAENLYTEDLLRARFDDFNIQFLESYQARVEEGEGHSGQSALIDLVARKRLSG